MMKLTTKTTHQARALTVTVSLAFAASNAACVSTQTTTASTGTASGGSASSVASGSTTGTSTSKGTTGSSTGSGTGGASGTPGFVDQLNAMQGQLPEGLFVRAQEAYFGLAPLGKIMRADLPGGAVHDFGSIPTPPANGGFLLGITLDAAGNVYVGFGAGPGTPVQNGIYKIPAAGGAVTAPFAQHPEMNFPNGLWLDPSNDIYVADSGGAIFDVKPDGTATKWASDPSLVGTSMACAHAAPFAIGANGIVRIGNDFYVSNTNIGQIVKIPIQANGSAGVASVFAGPDCDALGGIDGIAVDSDGVSILGLVNTQNKLVRIGSNGAVTTVYAGKPLDNPASLVLDGKTLYVTNSAFFDMASPMPGLLSIPLP